MLYREYKNKNNEIAKARGLVLPSAVATNSGDTITIPKLNVRRFRETKRVFEASFKPRFKEGWDSEQTYRN